MSLTLNMSIGGGNLELTDIKVKINLYSLVQIRRQTKKKGFPKVLAQRFKVVLQH